MTRTMYDSVTPASLPSGAPLYAAYVDGLYANAPQVQARFPQARIATVAVSWTTRARVLDVENGDATPEQAPDWCAQTMADVPNDELTVYANASTMPAVRAAFTAAGVSLPQLFMADYDGIAVLPPGYVAKQYADMGPYDVSVCADYWPGVDPAPTPPSPPSPPEDIVTPADAKLFVETLFGTPVWEAGDTPQNRTFQQLLEYLDQHYGNEVSQITTLGAQVTALSAALAAVAKGALTAAEVQAAVTAALAAAGHPPVGA